MKFYQDRFVDSPWGPYRPGTWIGCVVTAIIVITLFLTIAYWMFGGDATKHDWPIARWEQGMAQKALCETLRDRPLPVNKAELYAHAMHHYQEGSLERVPAALDLALASYQRKEWNEMDCGGWQWSGAHIGELNEILAIPTAQPTAFGFPL